MEKTYHIWIGYDPSEKEAYQVAKHSLENHATCKIKVHPLEHMELRRKGLFWREWEVDKTGQFSCKQDKKPFSTFFSHSRFLVPELWRNLDDPTKAELALFLDCDWLFLADINKLFEEIETKRVMRNYAHPVYCVQHNFNPQSTTKMHGVKQSAYNFKLWSAFMVFDMRHPDNAHLLPETVNTEDGRWLHQFGWLTEIHRIEPIDEGWNFIPNHSERNCSNIYAIHFTELGPWHSNGKTVRYASLWFDAYNQFLLSRLKDMRFDIYDGLLQI